MPLSSHSEATSQGRATEPPKDVEQRKQSKGRSKKGYLRGLRQQEASTARHRSSSSANRIHERGDWRKGATIAQKPEKQKRKPNKVKVNEKNFVELSEPSLSIDDLHHPQQQQPRDATGGSSRTVSSTGKRETRRSKRGSSKKKDVSTPRPSHPKHEKRRSSSVGPAYFLREGGEHRSKSQEPSQPYHGAMNMMVNQMHGSGSSLDYNDSLKISQHSQKKFYCSILPKLRADSFHRRQHFAGGHFEASVSSSSASSFAMASQNEWTGWSSSSSCDPLQKNISTVKSEPLHKDEYSNIKERRSSHANRAFSEQEISEKQQRRFEHGAPRRSRKTTQKVQLQKQNATMRNSSYATPQTMRSKFAVADLDISYSTAPPQTSSQTIKQRSVGRLKELLAKYEGPKVEEKGGPTIVSLPPIPASRSTTSPQRSPRRYVKKVHSGDATVRQTNRSTDLVDPEEQTEKHTNANHGKHSGKHTPPPPTSSCGYFSPWRAANARRVLTTSRKSTEKMDKVLPKSKQRDLATPTTQPLTGTPITKRTVEPVVLLQKISPPPLSSPLASPDKLINW